MLSSQLNDANDADVIKVWVQRAPYRLDKFLRSSCSFFSMMNLFKEIISIIEIIVKKYGFFRVTANMLKVNKNGFLQIWINESEECCYRSYPLHSNSIYEDYKLMIMDLVNLFSQYGQGLHLKEFKRRIFSQKFLSFEKAKSIIETLMN